MRIHLLKTSLLLIVVTLVNCCSSVQSQNQNSRALTPPLVAASPPSDTNLASQMDVNSLCENLSAIRKIPYRNPKDSDPIYDALIAKGDQAVPCLIEKITDITQMDDPREAPPVEGYTVGDTAVFVLLIITKQRDHPEKMLPPKYVKLWETEGVYSYFAYVEKFENRKKIQEWWRHWMEENIKH